MSRRPALRRSVVPMLTSGLDMDDAAAVAQELGAGALSITALTASVAVVISLIVHRHSLSRRLASVARRWGLLPARPPRPVGPPIERLARDLRRLRREAWEHEPGTPVAKHRGVVMAYDDRLVDACRALGIHTDLAHLKFEVERETERLRVEYEIEKSGIALSAG